VDGIILLPVDSSALAGKVKEAVDAGIPVVCMDRSVDGDIATCTIESDNYQHGVESADLMLAAAEAQGMKAEDLKVLELLCRSGETRRLCRPLRGAGHHHRQRAAHRVGQRGGL